MVDLYHAFCFLLLELVGSILLNHWTERRGRSLYLLLGGASFFMSGAIVGRIFLEYDSWWWVSTFGIANAGWGVSRAMLLRKYV